LRLRFLETPPSLPTFEKPDHLHHPLALGCCPLPASPATTPPSDGKASHTGEHLPNLSVVAEDPASVCKLTTIANWYGESKRMVEIASETAVWYSTGLFAVHVRWVLIHASLAEFKTQALLYTDLDTEPQKILS
jgi:hypothetical protein